MSNITKWSALIVAVVLLVGAAGALACGCGKGSSEKKATEETTAAKTYVCPMHPEVTSDKPGECPKCGMDLVAKDEAASGSAAEHAGDK